jgi:energy-coupling factor transport system ATP-binding protein
MRIRSPLSVQRPESAIFEYYAGDEVAFGPRNKGLKGAALVARVKSAMDSVALPYDEFRDRRARSLSGGEKRRLAIASVLSMDSEALLLDEPASALDPASKRSIMDLLFSFAKSDGNKEKAHHRTLVFATHSMEEAARADFVAVVGDGRLLAWGPPAHIFGPGWSASWGIGRTFAAEAVEAARLGGLCLPDGIIDLEGLKSSLVGAVP